MRLFHRFAEDSARFDDDGLVSMAGLVPVMTLAEQTGLTGLFDEKVAIDSPRATSGAANPAPKLATLIAGMCTGADSIDDLQVLRSGGMGSLFEGVYAPSTVGTLLREFTFGHTKQLESVMRAHLLALIERADLLPGIEVRALVDIDSLLRPVYGHRKQGASYGHTKIAGKQILRKGLSPLAAAIGTDLAAPVIAGIRLRAGKTGSGKGAASMVTAAIETARSAGATGEILVRGDSAYGTRKVVAAAVRAGARFSLVLTKNAAVRAAIASIPETAWTPVRYPGAVCDPDTGEWVSDAEVAEISYTAFASTKDRIHRAPDRAPREGRPLPRRPVPRLAIPPVLHRLHRKHRRRRRHPPQTRRHRDRVRRPHRRTTGPHARGEIRRQLRLDPVRRGRSQPAAYRRHTCREPARTSPRIDPAPQTRQHPRPTRSTTTPPGPAPAPPLALGRRVTDAVGQHNRLHTTTTSRHLTTPAIRPEPGNLVEMLGRPAVTPAPGTPAGLHAGGMQTRPTSDRWIQV